MKTLEIFGKNDTTRQEIVIRTYQLVLMDLSGPDNVLTLQVDVSIGLKNNFFCTLHFIKHSTN